MITTGVLYFPYIRVPSSLWFMRMLLYWDTVGTITPLDFIEDPSKLDVHTRVLVQEGLVKQIIPSWYLYQIPHFVPAFLSHLEQHGKEALDRRRSSFRSSGKGFRIHVEKLDELESELRNAGLARCDRYPWLMVEASTAQEFMEYLASCLGRLEDLASAPITDDPRYLIHFGQVGTSLRPAQLVEALRPVVLDAVLPAPAHPVQPADLASFKEKHGDLLGRFRRAIERALVDIADTSDEELRDRRLGMFLEEARDEIDNITAQMAGHGWVSTTLAKLTAIVAAVPGVPPGLGLANAVWEAFRKSEREFGRSPFLYAAEAQRAFPG